jgi:hypothetical protein
VLVSKILLLNHRKHLSVLISYSIVLLLRAMLSASVLDGATRKDRGEQGVTP